MIAKRATGARIKDFGAYATASSATPGTGLRSAGFHGRTSTNIIGPITHERAPFREQISAPVCRFDLIGNLVGQGFFNNLAAMVALFRCPVPEARAKAVCCDVQSHTPQSHQKGHVTDRPVAALAWKHKD